MKIFKNVILGLWLAGMVIAYVYLFITYAFPKDPKMEERIPIMEERAKQRAKAFEQMQLEAKCKDERFSHEDCD